MKYMSLPAWATASRITNASTACTTTAARSAGPGNFVEEVNDMCRSFVHHVFQTENFIGAASTSFTPTTG